MDSILTNTVSFFFFTYHVFLKGSHYVMPILKEWEVMLQFLKNVYTIYWKFL